jgi:hypothetical protein
MGHPVVGGGIARGNRRSFDSATLAQDDKSVGA